MAAADAQPLLKLGPFLGLDVTKSGPTVEAGYATSASNANPTIIENALTAERGRINMTDLASVLASISVIFPVQYTYEGVLGQNNSSFPMYLVGGLTSGGTFAAYFYDPSNGAKHAITYSGTTPSTFSSFDQAVQFGGVVYLNNGYRIFCNQGTPLSPNFTAYAWQYPPPVAFGNVTVSGASAYSTGAVDTSSSGPISTTGVLTTVTPLSMTNIANGITVVIDSGDQQELLPVSGCTGTTFQITPLKTHDTGFIIQGGIAEEAVYYLFTRVTTMPDGTTSETSCDLNQFASPPSSYNGSSAGTFNIAPINGYTWSGTNALDGSTFSTNFYRSSNLQPTFFFVANSATLGLGATSTWTDISPDTAIVGNAQLQTRDQPPCVPGAYLPSNEASQYNYGAIAIHKGRIWFYGIVQTTSDNNVPEVQLWYSNLGTPWEFDQVNQVLLLQSDVINQYANYPLNDGSTTYDYVYGNDPLALGEVGSWLMAFSRRQEWTVYGDSPSNFLARQVFNIGCVSRHAVTPTTGGIFWLSENGAYWFDGSSPQFIDGTIRGLLQAQPGSPAVSVYDQRQATGFFSNLTWYLAFPTLGYTLSYATVQGRWLSMLPYAPAAPAAVAYTPAYPSQYSSTGTLGGINEVVAARGSKSTSIDWLFADPNNDLGSPQSCTWNGPVTFCGDDKDSLEKIFSHLTLTGPAQPGSAIVTLTVDDGVQSSTSNVFEWEIPDLSVNTRFITSVGDGVGGNLRGFTAQLSVELTGVAGQPAPQLWRVVAWGTMSRNLVIPA